MDFKYKCQTCGQIHSGSPSFSFPAPYGYTNGVKLFDKLFNKKFLDTDMCVFNGSYFIRVTLEIPITNSEEKFMWGVWVSQSKENFELYKRNFHEDNSERETFGWFANVLPYYENTLNLKTRVIFQKKGMRPKIDLEKNTNELSKDFQNGISKEKAMKIAEIGLHQFEYNLNK